MFDPQTLTFTRDFFSPTKGYDCDFIGEKQASQNSDDVELLLYALLFDCVHVYKNVYKRGFKIEFIQRTIN